MSRAHDRNLWGWLGVVLLCALGLVLRLRGIGYLLPTVTQLDASVIVHQVETMRDAASASAGDQQAAYYPQLLARATSLLPDPRAVRDAGPVDLAAHLKRASDPWTQVRIVSVLLSILIVPGTWLLARRFFSRGWALVASALCATSLVHVAFSSQERPHGTAASFSLLCVLAALRLRRKPDATAYLLVGIAAGLAIGSLHYGVFVLPAVATAIALRERTPGRASAWWTLASLVIVALFVRWLYPFHFAQTKGFLSLEDVGGERALNLSGQPLFLEKFNGRGFVSIAENLWSYDPLILFSALLGIACAALSLRRGDAVIDRARRDDAWIALAYAVPYFLVIGMYAETWERFLLPLLPYLACLAVWGLRTLLDAALACFTTVPSRTRLAPALAFVVPALALVPAVNLGSARAAPSTMACAADWLASHAAPEDAIVVVPYVDVPLFDGPSALAENSKRPWMSNWLRYQMTMRPEDAIGPRFEVYVVPKPRLDAMRALADDPMAYFREFHARYVVIDVGSPGETGLGRALDALRANAELALRTTPERVDRGASTSFLQRHVDRVITRPFFLFVLGAARMGPTLEIYRLKP
jgi:hypothetical protein